MLLTKAALSITVLVLRAVSSTRCRFSFQLLRDQRVGGKPLRVLVCRLHSENDSSVILPPSSPSPLAAEVHTAVLVHAVHAVHAVLLTDVGVFQ